MGWMSKELGFHSWQGRKFLSYLQHQDLLKGLSNILSCGSGAVSPGIKQLMCEDYLSYPCRAEIKVLWG
jgi:hypothetical protein